MQKLIFANYPPKSTKMPDGRLRVYYNIEEKEESSAIIDPETGEPTGETETHTIYECEFVFVNELTLSAIVSAIIRKTYSVDDEFALLRQKESKVEEFATYNAVAENAKVIAHGIVD